jgi:putative FmdB family regulatory protein
MPTYDYTCEACNHAWEEFQSITATPSRKCPECGKRKAKRRIGPGAGIIFKGGGFYQTDYRSEAYKKAAEADSKATSGSTAASDGSSASAAASSSSESSGSNAKSASKKQS